MSQLWRSTGAAYLWRRCQAQGPLALAAAVLLMAIASAQAPTLTVVKAAFLYNFVNFAGWPADSLSAGQSLLLCVIDDTAVADALD